MRKRSYIFFRAYGAALLLSLIFVSSTAEAGSPWEGYWADKPINCAKGNVDTEGGVGPLFIDSRSVRDLDLFCDISESKTQGGGKFVLRLNCAVDGDEAPALLNGQIKGDRLKISMSGQLCQLWGPCEERVLRKCKK